MSDVAPDMQEIMTNFMSVMHAPTVPAVDIAPDLAPRIAEFGLENNCRQLADEGYTVVQDVAPPEFFARLRKTILEKANPYGSLLADKDPVFAEAALSFLGMGIPPPTPTWGNMLGGVLSNLYKPPWWMVVFPGVAITFTILAFNLLGDALRDHLDPRLRGRLE